MASEVDISNLALGHLGDSATVASIDPPEGSAQAEHCARFYPIARDSLLELHDWAFATTRVALAAVSFPFTEWRYAYARPSDALRIIAVLAADAQDDHAVTLPVYDTYLGAPQINVIGVYSPQRYATEIDVAGNQIILTNQVTATARYTRKITDTSRFSPLFVDALARLLASYLAGPVLKGDSGIAQGRAQLQIAMAMLGKAAVSGANQQHQDVGQSTPWLAGR